MAMDITSNKAIYLALQSPRRRELLEQIGVRFDLLPVDAEECRQQEETAKDYVKRLSLDKALAGAKIASDRPVLGADTIVVLGSEVLEKPISEEDSVAMLLAFSGVTHQVMTAVSVVYGNQQMTRLSTTSVSFRHISEVEARRYWQSGEPQDKAGGYGIQGLGAVFVERIEGSYSGVVGLPLFGTADRLLTFGMLTEKA